MQMVLISAQVVSPTSAVTNYVGAVYFAMLQNFSQTFGVCVSSRERNCPMRKGST